MFSFSAVTVFCAQYKRLLLNLVFYILIYVLTYNMLLLSVTFVFFLT